MRKVGLLGGHLLWNCKGHYSNHELLQLPKNSERLTLRISTTVSAKPTTYMATATALAKAKIRPIEPPNSGPKLLEIK